MLWAGEGGGRLNLLYLHPSLKKSDVYISVVFNVVYIVIVYFICLHLNNN